MLEEKSQTVPTPADAPDYEPPFRPLDARVVNLWRVTNLIGWSILLLPLLAAALWLSLWAKLASWELALGGWGALALLFLWLSLSRPARVYRAWGYRVAERVLETRSGLLFQRRRLLPLSRLQHVDLESGPFERMFGLASLVLHTAGTHSASLTIPGLDAAEAARLRDHLVASGGDDGV